MRLEWIDDILAVAETGSLIKAAERRCVTQSAFSRRIRMIEERLGVELFNRSRKPVELRSVVLDQQQELRELAARLRALSAEFQQQGSQTRKRIVLASQHAITAAIAPPMVRRMIANHDVGIRLRSANRDECYALLLTGQADIMLFYATDRHALAIESNFVEMQVLGSDSLIPVYARARLPEIEAGLARQELAIVSYPGNVFFGRVMSDEIWPRLSGLTILPKVETALTLAALQFARVEVAVAWVPRSLAEAHIASGELADLSPVLGAQPLTLAAARLNGTKSRTERDAWAAVLECASDGG